MSTGDQADMAQRMLRLLPSGWFGDSAPILGAVLAGAGAIISTVYTTISYVKLQTRIATATDYNLDIISQDFFASGLPRNAGESDSSFRARIMASMFRPAGTRSAVQGAASLITGAAVVVFEPNNVGDTGGYNAGGLGYNAGGGYGSMLIPGQAFITAPRSANGSTQAQVYAAINAARPASSIMWTQT